MSARMKPTAPERSRTQATWQPGAVATSETRRFFHSPSPRVSQTGGDPVDGGA